MKANFINRATTFAFFFSTAFVMLTFVLSTSFGASSILAEEPQNSDAASVPILTGSARPLRIVYFTPCDVEPYDDRAERLGRVMKYVQDFYRREMERNGFGEQTFGLEWTEPNRLKLYEVVGAKPQTEYGRNDWDKVRREVADALARLQINADREVVVIFQRLLSWKDGKATELGPYVGGGTLNSGTAWVYDDPILDSELLSSKEPGGYYVRPCSIGEFNSHYIGGIAHELGHALTLPHDRQLDVDSQRGSALMGAGNHTFGQELRAEGPGTFLTKSETLRLSIVPAITGAAPPTQRANFQLIELKGARISESEFKLTGVVASDRPILGLIVYNDRDSLASDYDAKSWTTRPQENGAFEITLTEVTAEPCELRFCGVSDVGASTFATFRYVPDGRPGEFAQLERFCRLNRVRSLYAAADAASLERLATDEFVDDASLAELSQKLAEVAKKPNEFEIPGDVDKSLQTFDLTQAALDVEECGWSRCWRDKVPEETLAQVGGEFFARCLFAHAPSRLECRLGKNWKKLTFGYGLQDSRAGSVVFVVRADGREIFRSSVVKRLQFERVELSVEGIETLELATEPTEDGRNSDWSIWVEPALSR